MDGRRKGAEIGPPGLADGRPPTSPPSCSQNFEVRRKGAKWPSHSVLLYVCVSHIRPHPPTHSPLVIIPRSLDTLCLSSYPHTSTPSSPVFSAQTPLSLHSSAQPPPQTIKPKNPTERGTTHPHTIPTSSTSSREMAISVTCAYSKFCEQREVAMSAAPIGRPGWARFRLFDGVIARPRIAGPYRSDSILVIDENPSQNEMVGGSSPQCRTDLA